MSDCVLPTNNIDIVQFFKDDIRDPFSCNIKLNCDTVEKLFIKIKDIFIKGLIIHVGDEVKNTVNIDYVTDRDIEKVKKYMLSFGIDVIMKKYNDKEKDHLYTGFLYEIENIPDLDIKVVMDWKTNLITKIYLNVTNNNQDSVKKNFRNNRKTHPS